MLKYKQIMQKCEISTSKPEIFKKMKKRNILVPCAIVSGLLALILLIILGLYMGPTFGKVSFGCLFLVW